MRRRSQRRLPRWPRARCRADGCANDAALLIEAGSVGPPPDAFLTKRPERLSPSEWLELARVRLASSGQCTVTDVPVTTTSYRSISSGRSGSEYEAGCVRVTAREQRLREA